MRDTVRTVKSRSRRLSGFGDGRMREKENAEGMSVAKKKAGSIDPAQKNIL